MLGGTAGAGRLPLGLNGSSRLVRLCALHGASPFQGLAVALPCAWYLALPAGLAGWPCPAAAQHRALPFRPPLPRCGVCAVWDEVGLGKVKFLQVPASAPLTERAHHCSPLDLRRWH